MNGEVNVIENKKIASDLYLITVDCDVEVTAGQFCMLKVPYSDTSLYRPISIFDSSRGELSFLYMVRGKGTKAMSRLRSGDTILVHGPYGNGFPKVKGRLALIGGGIGMAPLYLCAKNHSDSKVYIGVREERYTQKEIASIESLFKGIDVHIKVGGTIFDDIAFDTYDTVFCCGPTGMMKSVSSVHQNAYVSLENHMGCGIGACLSCSCKTSHGMKKTCKDGPVFQAKEVLW